MCNFIGAYIFIIFEERVRDDFMEVEPDANTGLYTSTHVKKAEPTRQQLDSKKVWHHMVY